MTIAFPEPDEASPVAPRGDRRRPARGLCPGKALIVTEDESRAFETDGLTAYRQMPLAVVLPSSTARGRGDPALLPRERREGRAARRRHLPVRRRHAAGGCHRARGLPR